MVLLESEQVGPRRVAARSGLRGPVLGTPAGHRPREASPCWPWREEAGRDPGTRQARPPPVGAVRAAPGERAGGIRSQAVWCACVTVPHGADETLPEVQDFGERFHNAEEM